MVLSAVEWGAILAPGEMPPKIAVGQTVFEWAPEQHKGINNPGFGKVMGKVTKLGKGGKVYVSWADDKDNGYISKEFLRPALNLQQGIQTVPDARGRYSTYVVKELLKEGGVRCTQETFVKRKKTSADDAAAAVAAARVPDSPAQATGAAAAAESTTVEESTAAEEQVPDASSTPPDEGVEAEASSTPPDEGVEAEASSTPPDEGVEAEASSTPPAKLRKKWLRCLVAPLSATERGNINAALAKAGIVVAKQPGLYKFLTRVAKVTMQKAMLITC